MRSEAERRSCALVTDGDLISPEAEAQLDILEAGPDEDLYDSILDAIDRVLDFPDLEFVFWNAADGATRILGVGALPLR